MKKFLLVSIFFIAAFATRAQKIDSIFFNLYTDSLKKGTHNYINIDGKMSDGSWRPLMEKDIEFSASECKFSGNELIIPHDFKGEKITVKAVLRSNPAMSLEKTIWIKKKPDPARLPTNEEILRKMKKGKS